MTVVELDLVLGQLGVRSHENIAQQQRRLRVVREGTKSETLHAVYNKSDFAQRLPTLPRLPAPKT